MAAAEGNSKVASSGVVKLQNRPKGESLWVDAWRRLRRNRMAILGLVIIVLNILMALFAPVLAPKHYADDTLADSNTVPRWVTQVFPRMIPVGQEGGYVEINENYPLGADRNGRDLLSRIIYGSQISLMVAFIGPLAALLVGLTLGMISGYAGGWLDNLIMRLVDIMYAFPTLLLIILLMSFFRSSFAQTEPGTFAYVMGRIDRDSGGVLFIFIGIGLTSWMNLARLVRGQILSVREKEYVEAARAMGVGTRGLMLRHMLPNILGPVIVAETLTIPTYISYEAFLSFIGLGVLPPRPSWGAMIADGGGTATISTYPYQAIFPAVALFLIMFAFNFLGDGLRDALDPRMRGVD